MPSLFLNDYEIMFSLQVPRDSALLKKRLIFLIACPFVLPKWTFLHVLVHCASFKKSYDKKSNTQQGFSKIPC